jgi:hypothetical protein
LAATAAAALRSLWWLGRDGWRWWWVAVCVCVRGVEWKDREGEGIADAFDATDFNWPQAARSIASCLCSQEPARNRICGEACAFDAGVSRNRTHFCSVAFDFLVPLSVLLLFSPRLTCITSHSKQASKLYTQANTLQLKLCRHATDKDRLG